MQMATPQWTNLPKDLIEQISKHLETSTDFLRLRSVCSAWRSALSPPPIHASPVTFRILPNQGISDTSFGFSLSIRTVFLITPPYPRNQTHSNPGWLVKIEQDVPQRKHLLNPLSRSQFNSWPANFPRVLDLLNLRVCEMGQEFVLRHVNYGFSRSNTGAYSNVGNLYMEKVAMLWLCDDSGLSDFSQYMLLTIHVSGKLALFRSGNKKWTIIQEMPSPYDDVIVYKGRFYAVDNTGRIVVVKANADMEVIAEPIFGGDKKFLVESNGELLLVDMYLSIDTEEGTISVQEDFLEHLAQYMSERTVKFKVYRLDMEARIWIEMWNLGNRVLFLGDDSTFSASASELSGCKGNCIFFVDNFFYPGGVDNGELDSRDIGVCDLDSGCIGPLGNYPEYSKMFWPPPQWLTSTMLEAQNQAQLHRLSLGGET